MSLVPTSFGNFLYSPPLKQSFLLSVIVEYYKIALSVLDEKTFDREFLSLEKVKDHNQKFLLTMDYLPINYHNGIKQMNILEWMLSNT